jgi:hypothetical protein
VSVKVMRFLIGLIVLAALLAAAPAASAQSQAFGPVRFANGATEITVLDGSRVKVTGDIRDDNFCYIAVHTVTMYEYVRVAPGAGGLRLLSTQSYSYQPGEGGAPFQPGVPFPFSFELEPGPGRTLSFSVSNVNCGLIYSSDSLKLHVLAQPTFEVNRSKVRNGKRVRFSGQLHGPYYGGAPVFALQVKVGKKWRTFKAVKGDPSGAFGGQYRFTATRVKQTYKFRAKPLTDPDTYPFIALPSRRVKVKVVP